MMREASKKRTHTDYISRINNVFDYIEKNIDQNISLDELAAVSHFSKYHFSRIFDAMVGETPFEFVKRLRLEKAATRLRLYPDEIITETALECGFNDLAVFSRNFSEFFGMSPTEWQNGVPENSNHSQTSDSSDLYLDTEHNRNHNMENLRWRSAYPYNLCSVSQIKGEPLCQPIPLLNRSESKNILNR